MKTRIFNISFGRFLASFVISALAFMSTQAQAVQAIRVPSVISVPYSLAPGAISAPISIPSNTPIQLMGTQTAVGFRGVASATLLSIPGAGGFVEWTGLESTAGSVITQGFSGALGTHILFLDFSHSVHVEVGAPASATANTIRIRNASGVAATGSVTLIY